MSTTGFSFVLLRRCPATAFWGVIKRRAVPSAGVGAGAERRYEVPARGVGAERRREAGVWIQDMCVCVGLGCGACFGAEIDLHQFLVRAKHLILSSGVAAGIARQGFRFPFAVGSLSGRRRGAIVERTKNRRE